MFPELQDADSLILTAGVVNSLTPQTISRELLRHSAASCREIGWKTARLRGTRAWQGKMFFASAARPAMADFRKGKSPAMWTRSSDRETSANGKGRERVLLQRLLARLPLHDAEYPHSESSSLITTPSILTFAARFWMMYLHKLPDIALESRWLFYSELAASPLQQPLSAQPWPLCCCCPVWRVSLNSRTPWFLLHLLLPRHCLL